MHISVYLFHITRINNEMKDILFIFHLNLTQNTPSALPSANYNPILKHIFRI